jgi:hypothetical protein
MPKPKLQSLAKLAPSVAKRQSMERKIARKTIRLFQAASYMLAVEADGQRYTLRGANEAELMAAMFDLDECRLVVFTEAFGKPFRIGRVDFVFGNDGFDCVSDYSASHSIEAIMEEVMKYANKLERS